MNTFHLTDSKDNIIYSNLHQDCIECLNKVLADGSPKMRFCKIDQSKERKQGALQTGQGKAYYCTDDLNEINSQRLFKEKLRLFASLLVDLTKIKTEISDQVNKDTKRLLHNVTSINAHNIQELYAMVPQEILTKNPKNQYEAIKSYIAQDLEESAKTFLRIAKNNASLKTEFAVFKKLFETTPILQIKKHAIRKVLLNLFHIFFPDFSDNDVYVEIDETYKSLNLDYESMHVALFHLIDNATKYILPKSKLKVSFNETEESFVINFEMISMQIKPNEVDSIFLDGVCGESALKSEKAGNGIGMSFIKKIMQLNNGDFQIKTNLGTKRYFNGINYERNIFSLVFYYTK